MASRHTPNTTATVGTFSEMIPADHWELREREKAVCHNDFTSGEDHGPTRGSEAILNAWRLNKETHLVSSDRSRSIGLFLLDESTDRTIDSLA